MTLEELKEKAATLSVDERLELISAIAQSLQTHPKQEDSQDTEWNFLEQRSHPWRQQLYVKGMRLRAYTIWYDMQANDMTIEEAQDNWDLPAAAIEEAIKYCESHQELLTAEAIKEHESSTQKEASREPVSAG